MGVWTRRSPAASPAVGSTLNQTDYPTPAAFTPVAGELLVAYTDSTGSLATAPVLTDSANGIQFIRAVTLETNAAVNGRMIAWVADRPVPANPQPMTLTLTFTSGDAATGANIFVVGQPGMSKFGLSAVRQFATAVLPGGSAPQLALPQAPLTTNPLLGLIGNVTGSATAITPPANWTEIGRQSYSTPTKGSYVHGRASGAISANIAWGSNSTAGGVIALELDASAPAAATDGYWGILL